MASHRQRARGRVGVALRLHGVAALTFAAVLAIAGASVHFADRTGTAATLLRDDGIVGNDTAARLEVLLQQHRRVVESAPAEVDRNRLGAARRVVQDLGAKLAAELGGGQPVRGGPGEAAVDRTKDDRTTDRLAGRLVQELPGLVAAADQVLGLAYNMLQDQALEASQGAYATVADRMQGQVAAWRAERAAILDAQVRHMSASARTLVSWSFGSTLAALLLGVLGVATTRGVLRRLGGVERAMLRLAGNDTAVPVPCLGDGDEIGAMASAVQVFKENAAELLAQKAELQRANQRFETALGSMSQGLCQYDAQDRLEVFNERFCAIFGVGRAQLRPGMAYAEVMGLVAGAGAANDRTARPRGSAAGLRPALPHGRPPGAVLLDLPGDRVVQVSFCAMASGGWVATYEDVTERHSTQEKLSYMARHDALTDLPNRVLLREHMEAVLARLRRGGKAAAVLCLDLDGFKGVNDLLGHAAGDELLRQVARRLAEQTREAELVARLGGDEFAVVQADLPQGDAGTPADAPASATALAARLVEALATPFELAGERVKIGTSIGIALADAPTQGRSGDPASTTVDALLRNADVALYRAKAEGRGTWRVFEPGMDAAIQRRRLLETHLRQALAEEQFELHYQPLVKAGTRALTGFEALLRWRHPERGMVSPAEFIPLAEEMGLIRPLGAWVLARACADAAGWPAHVKVAVNLSPAQFTRGDLVREVRDCLAASGLRPDRLELEITESVLLRDNEDTLAVLHRLRRLGVRISMDDFGTGYSSLSYLRRFPFDKIKVDQSFVRNLGREPGSVEIVRAVVGLGKALGMGVLAEGVEQEEQAGILRDEGCDELQGFLFSRPLPVRDVPRLLAGLPARIDPPRGVLPSPLLVVDNTAGTQSAA